MFFAVVLSLAALAAAGPVNQYGLQQQEVEDVNYIPTYKHLYYPYIYGNRYNRYVPYYGQAKETPLLPYMSYPYRMSYVREMSKPGMVAPTPKVDYDAQDIYHLHDVNHHHMINNIHDFKQKEVLRNLEYPYLPYSPMYYDKYMNSYKYYNRGYPYVNKYYGKSMEQEYVQPWSNSYYNRLWDVNYIRNYYNRYLDYVQPIYTQSSGVEYAMPKNLDYDYVKPVIPKNLDYEYVKPVNTKTFNTEYIKPASGNEFYKNMNLDYIQPTISKNLDLAGYIQPVISKNTDLEFVKPVITKSLDLGYEQPHLSRKMDLELVKPIWAKNLVNTHQPLMGQWDVEYVKPTHQGIKFIPGVSSRTLAESTLVPSQNWELEGRFKRDVQVGINSELEHPTPAIDLSRHEVATNVEVMHQAPMMTEGHEAVHGQVPQGVQRQEGQLNANLEHSVQPEPISQQPIQRQTRATQSPVIISSYVDYLDADLPITTPVVRSGSYPNYCDIFLCRK